jgi:hypothetical protein
MPYPNLASPTNVAGKNDVLAVTTTPTAITSNITTGNEPQKLIHSESLTVCNVTDAAATVTVDLYSGGGDPTEICVIVVGAKSMLEVIDKTTPKKLLTGQSLRLTGSVNSALKAIHTYLEIT